MTSTAQATGSGIHFHFDNSYARLPERFYAPTVPTPVADPRLIKLNKNLASLLGLDIQELTSAEGVEILAGNRIAAGSSPLAMAYAGHQFGNFVPQLGDGRANLIGEVVGRDDVRYDIQLKGAGRTRFSRGGDGRAALGPVMREYIVSEAMAALGVPTTRALAIVASGEPVFRETPLPGAILTRVATGHLRVGSFQYFGARGDIDGTRILADYALQRHYPELAHATPRYRSFLDGVVARQARLVAHWLLLGFVHGVMNTDNTSISGETIDYGPCAFLEAYDPNTVFSSIDHQGRYAFKNQPYAMHWNLARLAEALLPLLVEEAGSTDAALTSAHEALNQFVPTFEAAFQQGMRSKLGLAKQQDGDAGLVEDLLQQMASSHADYTLTFRRLAEAAADDQQSGRLRNLFSEPEAFDRWEARWRHRSTMEERSPGEQSAQMRLSNPAFIARNHLVEAALRAATERSDFQPFEDLMDVLARPFDDQPDAELYATPARPEEHVSSTFCGI